MCVTKRYKRFLLLVLYILLPFFLPAQGLDTMYLANTTEAPESEPEVKAHSLWDNSVPVNVDSTEEWWVNGGLVERKVPETTLKKLRADKDLQYDKKEDTQPQNQWILLLLSAIVQFLQSIRLLIVILLVGGLLFLIVYFMRQQGFRFSGKGAEAEMPGVEEVDPGAAGYEKQVQDAINGGQFRQAVRFLHLQSLRLLAERQLITLSKDKTNADYLRVLLKTQWYQPFSRLTRDYEYIWYGDVQVNAEQFSRIHGQFRQFINELGYTR
jgi:hypothetical protein